MKDVFNSVTVASDSFGVDLQGSFRTASFGGEKLGMQADVNGPSAVAELASKPFDFN